MCYIYPAVFYREVDGRYSVIFPDLNDLATYGNDFCGCICDGPGGMWAVSLQ